MGGTVIVRRLERGEIEQIWSIDRSEVIDHVYYLRDGELVLEPEHYDMAGWPPGEEDRYQPILDDCFDRGGALWGAFDGSRLAAAAILESRFIGKKRDQLQLKFLHVSRPYRGTGLGRVLFVQAVEKARELGAGSIYISATPSANTVDFYRHLGCVLTPEVDPALYELEPEDIHLAYTIPNPGSTEEGSS
jgi:predicted N-acetyltransferase YhbS